MLSNQTPYAAERSWTRDKEGVHLWLVTVKVTFDIAPAGKLTLSDVQPPLLAPEHRGDAATSSLRLDSDLLAVKPTTDVLLDACAHAPHGKAVPTVPVTLRLGVIEKTLLVHGTRVYYSGRNEVALRVDLGSGKPPFNVETELLYQPIGYRWAENMEKTGGAEPRAFVRAFRTAIPGGYERLARAERLTPLAAPTP